MKLDPTHVGETSGTSSLLLAGMSRLVGEWCSGGRSRGVGFVCFSTTCRNDGWVGIALQVRKTPPRARGDGPSRLIRVMFDVDSSPRTRGWPPHT